MSKNGAIVILNDFKKRRDEIEMKYKEQKTKKITKKHIFIYSLGFICAFGVACFTFPTSIVVSSCILAGYGLGVPFTYSFVQYNKEENLKNELNRFNKQIDKLELELTGINVNHHYVDENRGFVFDKNGVPFKNTNLESGYIDDTIKQEESGPILKRKL
jgi:hypothetical protein